jgi:hypothetical protein
MTAAEELSPQDIAELLPYLNTDERAELNAILEAERTLWEPLPGPQTLAYESKADIIGYGGAAGGGKTDLIAGLSITKHKRVLVVRREKAQTEGFTQRMAEIIGSTVGYNSQKSLWRVNAGSAPLIEFGGLDNLGDERRWQGRAHDLKAFDEATEMREAQVRFIMGWMRTANDAIRTQVLLTFNPPTTTEGRWVIAFFAPWLDKKHPNRAMPGELRWFTTIDGRDFEVPDARPFVLVDGAPVYDFDETAFSPEEILRPLSRTFIPARVTDNPHYMRSGYMRTLQSLPEPLRSQMLYGDFEAGMQDDPWQLIPTAWVEAAQARWKRPDILPEMLSLGVDVARGGKDNTIIARRHAPMWFDVPLVYPGSATPDGPQVAGLTIASMRDNAPIHIDVIGVGASPYDFLVSARQQVTGVNVSEKALGTDKSGRLRFKNLRSQLYWMFREALDPANNTGIALPPDPRLLADLCAFTWELQGAVIYVEGREDIVKRIGRSPDWASAYVLALIDTPKASLLRTLNQPNASLHYDPLAQVDSCHNQPQRQYDPLNFDR